MADDDLLSMLGALEGKLLTRSFGGSEDLRDLLSDDFVEFSRSGAVYDRTEIITALLAEQANRFHSAAELTNLTLRRLASDVVLLTYSSFRHAEDGSVTRRSLRSSIWRNTNERWQMVFHQATPTQ